MGRESSTCSGALVDMRCDGFFGVPEGCRLPGWQGRRGGAAIMPEGGLSGWRRASRFRKGG